MRHSSDDLGVFQKGIMVFLENMLKGIVYP